MKRFSQLLFLLSFIAQTGYAQTAPDLKELVDSAMAQDFGLLQRKMELKLTSLDDEKLKDVFLPKVEFTRKAGYLYTSTKFTSPEIAVPPIPKVFPGAIIPEGSFNDRLNISGVTALLDAKASMLLYSGGKVKYLKEANKEKAIAENKLLLKNEDEIIAIISKMYDQFALLDESTKVLKQGQKRYEIMKTTADKALSYGLITPYDHKKIELAQAVLESKMVELDGKRTLLQTQLSLLTGIELDRIQMIHPAIKPIEITAPSKTINDRVDVQAIEHSIKGIDYKIKADQRWWVPKVMAQTSLSTVGLYSGHITSAHELKAGSGKNLDWHPNNMNLLPVFQVGVGFKWNLFDGKEGKHEVAKSKIEKQLMEGKLNDVKDKLQLNLANSQINYNVAASQINLKLKAKEIAASALVSIEKEFRYGTKKSTDFIDAETDLQNAELEYSTAIFNQRRAAIDLMNATNELTINKL
ncbi:MAG TPA: TolC family protein [Niabella sp.]|nr:TolC family protein [Niabella sp.]HOZ96741.1 TolC family protein [Niabella sp.]HQW14782.1 TolC family protein [Niabella sp.]HQX19966.1 TolC family protein [Niabella sp.]HQX42202.1 TolC family protein [Niabella sp.]